MNDERGILVRDAGLTKFRQMQLGYTACLSVHHTPSLDEGYLRNDMTSARCLSALGIDPEGADS